MEEFYKQYAELDKDEVQAQEIVDMIRSSLIPGKDSLITYLNKGIDQGFTVMEKDSMFDLIRLWHNDQSIVEDISYLVQCSRSQSMLMSEMPEFIDSPGNSFHLSNMDNDSHIMFNQGLDRAKSPKPRKNSLSLNSPQRERFQKNRKFFTEAEDPNLSGSSAGSKIHDDPFRLDEFGSHDMILDTSKPSIMGTPLKQSMTINNSVFGSSPFKASELSPFRQKLDQESDNERTPIDLKSIVKENSNNGKQDFFSTVQQRSKIDPDVSNLISLSPMQPTSIDSAKLSSVESGSDYHESPTRVKSAVQRNSPLVSSSSRLPKLSKANPSPLRHNLEPLKELEPLTPISPITDEGLDSPAKHRRQIASLEETLKQFEDRVTELEQQNGILIMDNTSMRKQTVELKSKNSSLSTQKIELEMDIGKLKDEMIKEKNNGNSQYGQLNGIDC